MDNSILSNVDFFMDYMRNTKNASDNTLQSYKRDLLAMAVYFGEQDINDVAKINATNINSYILYMEHQGKSAATISRSVSSIKTFFRCMINNGMVKREPTENLQTPQNDRKKTEAISAENMARIIAQIGDGDSKALRDNAMCKLMLDTGLRVSEIIEIKLADVNMQYAYVTCHGRKKDKTIRFSNDTLLALQRYINHARTTFIKTEDTGELFLNCYGKKMSRQGFWKMFKEYAELAGVVGATARAVHR